jgi:hypothetical protein
MSHTKPEKLANHYQPEALVPRLEEMNSESRAAVAHLFAEPNRAASTLNVLNNANYLSVVQCDDLESLPLFVSEGLQPEDLERIREISFNPDEFEFLKEFFAELYPNWDDPLAQAKQELYDEEVEDAADGIQDEILSDREASYVVMGLALKLSHRWDRDQQAVADDIIASFTYSHGMSPEDYADSVRNRADTP